MSKDTGGAAFPVSDGQTVHRIGAVAIEGLTEVEERDRVYLAATAAAAMGMTLRDYFAAKALTAVVGAIMPQECHRWSLAAFAEEAYALADAMLAERAK